MDSTGDQRDIDAVDDHGQNLATVTGHGGREESTELRYVNDAAGLAQGDGAFLPPRAEHDRDVIGVEATSLAQLARGALG